MRMRLARFGVAALPIIGAAAVANAQTTRPVTDSADHFGDVLGSGAEAANQPGLGPAERGTDRSFVRRIGVAVGG